MISCQLTETKCNFGLVFIKTERFFFQQRLIKVKILLRDRDPGNSHSGNCSTDSAVPHKYNVYPEKHLQGQWLPFQIRSKPSPSQHRPHTYSYWSLFPGSPRRKPNLGTCWHLPQTPAPKTQLYMPFCAPLLKA